MYATANHLRMSQPLDLPPDKKIKARCVAWFRYFVDKSSKKDVAKQMGMSLAHISNVYNHPDEHGPGLSFFLRVHMGLDITLRELVYEDPPKPTALTRQTIAGHPVARKRA